MVTAEHLKKLLGNANRGGMLSGLGATQTMMNMLHLIVSCFHLVQMLCKINTLLVLYQTKTEAL